MRFYSRQHQHIHTSHGGWRHWRVPLLFDDVINVALKHWHDSAICSTRKTPIATLRRASRTSLGQWRTSLGQWRHMPNTFMFSRNVPKQNNTLYIIGVKLTSLFLSLATACTSWENYYECTTCISFTKKNHHKPRVCLLYASGYLLLKNRSAKILLDTYLHCIRQMPVTSSNNLSSGCDRNL